MKDPARSDRCRPGACSCAPAGGVSRREFLRCAGLTAAGLALPGIPVVAGPFEAADFEHLVPRDKKLRPEWIASLFRRGEPEVWRGKDLEHIGMPVGGIACGQLYLGGDGRLWYWDLFRPATTTDYDGRVWAGLKYEHPAPAIPTVAQGFAVRVRSGATTVVRTLDRRGFQDVSFRGEYPIGRVTYRDPGVPIQVSLEAFSPFIPLDLEASTIPATVLEFTLRNTGTAPAEVDLAGWLENAVLRGVTGQPSLERRNRIIREDGAAILLGSAGAKAPAGPVRPEILHADFEDGTYGPWRTEGTAFGDRPFRLKELPPRQPLTGMSGEGVVTSHESRHGEDSEAADRHTGRLMGPEFKVERRFILFRIAGGNHPGETGIHLVVDGKTVRQATGDNSLALRQEWFDVAEFEGRKARLEIVDTATGGWGHTTVDQIIFADAPPTLAPEEAPGWGSLALALRGDPAGALAAADLDGAEDPERIFARLDAPGAAEAARPLAERLTGALGRRLRIEPGAEGRATFILAWWFPSYGNVQGEMTAIGGSGKLRRRYAGRFDGAGAAACHVLGDLDRLAGETRLWNRTWYDSTLPYWFLDRTFVTADCLATQTLHAFEGGRWWGWEGVDCCPGTCQHVWQYAQAAAWLFPALERDWRERVDFGLAWHPSGAMDYRSESGRDVAHDGFCGTILRVYREHRMSQDGEFLRRLWPRVRNSLEFIQAQDADGDGLLEGLQMNTLDAAWAGPMGWISSLYLAAVAAGEAMAREMGDADFAGRCRGFLERGRRSLVEKLFDGEYFIHLPPDLKRTNTNRGCHIDQMLGQTMAFGAGLPRIVPEKEARSALRALWTYNFSPDVGVYREGMKGILPAGRWYAMPGEGGLLMCTWPKGGAGDAAGDGNPTFVGYFNECMTGFEYGVAAHMMWEGMTMESLAIVRTIHDRYGPSKRNPFNEIECSDHYSRAMMSYAVILAACGFEHHGPAGHLGFAPRWGAEAFRAPFTAAGGWGTIAQARKGTAQEETVEVRWGSLRLRSLSFEVPEGAKVASVAASAAKAASAAGAESGVGAPAAEAAAVEASFVQEGVRVRIALAREVLLERGRSLSVVLRWS